MTQMNGRHKAIMLRIDDYNDVVKIKSTDSGNISMSEFMHVMIRFWKEHKHG